MIIRTLIAFAVFASLTIAQVELTDRPLPTAGYWFMSLIMAAIVTEVISRIDRRRRSNR